MCSLYSIFLLFWLLLHPFSNLRSSWSLCFLALSYHPPPFLFSSVIPLCPYLLQCPSPLFPVHPPSLCCHWLKPRYVVGAHRWAPPHEIDQVCFCRSPRDEQSLLNGQTRLNAHNQHVMEMGLGASGDSGRKLWGLEDGENEMHCKKREENKFPLVALYWLCVKSKWSAWGKICSSN